MSEAPDTSTPEPDVVPAEPQTVPAVPASPDEGEESPATPEAPTEPEEAPEERASDIVAEEDFRRLESERRRHANAITRLVGDEDAQALTVCPLCDPFQGFRFPVPLTAEEQQAVLALLGQAMEEGLQKAPDARMCDACNGLGKVLTGSRVPNMDTKACAACNGSGYVIVAVTNENGGAVAPPPASAQEGGAPGDFAGKPDPWGRPPDHPDWWKAPPVPATPVATPQG